MKKAYIFCSAPIKDYGYLKKLDYSDSLLICADGGLRHAAALGLTPHIWIGDKDSCALEIPSDTEAFLYPTDKDFTDTNLAIDCALKQNCNEIIFIGALGGRLDHEYSHYCLLKYILEKGGHGILLNEHNEITMAAPSDFVLHRNEKKYVSFLPFGDVVKGLCIRGLKYEAENFTLYNGKVQATCNEFADSDSAHISFTEGYLLIMRCDDGA